MTPEQILEIAQLNKFRQDRLDFVEAQYNTPTLQQYRDNERYSWAVKKINESYDNQIKEITNTNA